MIWVLSLEKLGRFPSEVKTPISDYVKAIAALNVQDRKDTNAPPAANPTATEKRNKGADSWLQLPP